MIDAGPIAVIDVDVPRPLSSERIALGFVFLTLVALAALS